MRQRSITLNWRGTFSAPVDQLWKLLSDTDRIDQAAGLPATIFHQETQPNGQVVLAARATYFGRPLQWIEHPFEWSSGQWFSVERVFARAPLVHRIRTGARFTPIGPDTTEIEILTEFEPRTFLGGLVIRLVVTRIYMPRLIKLYRQIAETHSRGLADPYLQLPHSPVSEAHLARGIERVREAPVRGELVDRLVAHLREAEDREVVRMQPFVLADRWGVDRIELLRIFLYATRAGVVDASWNVLCPNCRVPNVSFGSLSEVRPEVHCDACNISYAATFDEYVELRFTVCRPIRVADVPTFCIAGPANLRHIVGQVRVPAHDEAALSVSCTPGAYRLRVRGWLERGAIEVDQAGTASEIGISFGSDGLRPLELRLQPGNRTLRVANQSEQEILLLIEQDAWGTQAASAALVTSLQEFRQLFSSDVLSPGTSVAIRTLTILFSDLKGSTNLYATAGDTPAYAQVRDHFGVLTRVIAHHHGATVKTIGDAVMAVFLVAADAAVAALDILTEIEMLNARNPERPPLSIKLGLHSGSCIAINANDVLDYFGTAVNLAARAHAQSRGGEVVVTEAVVDDAGVQEALERRSVTPERFESELAGFHGAFPLFRLQGGSDE